MFYLPANDEPQIYSEIVLQFSKGKLQTSSIYLYVFVKKIYDMLQYGSLCVLVCTEFEIDHC